MYRKRFLSLAFIAVAGLAALGAALLFPSLVVLRNNEAVLIEKRDLLRSQETNTIKHSLEAATNEIIARLAILSDKGEASPVVAGFIDPVLAAKTNAVQLSDLSYLSGGKNTVKIQISGIAQNRETLLAFVDNLKKISRFSDVTVPIQNFIKDSNIAFTVTAAITTDTAIVAKPKS